MEIEEAKMEIMNPHRSYARSEARIRYSKRPQEQNFRRYSREQEKKPAQGFKERLIFQATICGGLLAVMLFLNIVDNAFTNSIMSWIGTSVSYDMLAESGGAENWLNSIIDFFDSSTPEVDLEHNETFLPLLNTPAPQSGTNSINLNRIDENILNEINNTIDIYYENNR